MSLVGRLEDLALSDIFQILSIGKKTGTLIIKGSTGTSMIIFKGGLVHRAESNILEKGIVEDLVEAGSIKNKSAVKMAGEVKKKLPEKSITEILFEFGAVKKDTIEKFTKKRIERIIYKLLVLQEGDFQFELDDLKLNGKTDLNDYGWELTKGVSPEYLLMEGARVYDESSHGMFSPEEEISGGQGGEAWEEEWSETPVAAERKDMSSLRALTQELRFPNTTSEITLLILRFASEIFQRGVFFIVGQEEIIGLGQFGLEIEKADEKIRQTRLPLYESPFLGRIVDEGRFYKGALEKDAVLELMMNELGGMWPPMAAFFPLIADEKVVALLYCDNGTSDGDVQTEGLEIFINQAGIALEKALLKRRLGEFEKEREF
jgi:hypothetical protein